MIDRLKIAFRVDASIEIGTGHVMRCLTLADELARQGHQCAFICRAHAGHLGELITAKSHELHLLPNPLKPGAQPLSEGSKNLYTDWLGVPWYEDAEQTRGVLSSLRPDWLIVDHYSLDARWERRVDDLLGRIMVIDDLADRNHECSLLLDQNLGRKSRDYDHRVPDKCLRLIGPRYALLRPEFREWRGKSLARRQEPKLKRILISLGGVDRTNVTGRVLAALSDTSLLTSTCLDIVMGATAPALMEVQAQVEAMPFEATVSVNVRNMAERMHLADLSIGAAGSTSWERCCLGLPAIMIILAENQQLIAEALASNNAAWHVEQGDITQRLGSLVNGLIEMPREIESYSQSSAKICDGDGVLRLMSILTGSS